METPQNFLLFITLAEYRQSFVHILMKFIASLLTSIWFSEFYISDVRITKDKQNILFLFIYIESICYVIKPGQEICWSSTWVAR